MAPWVVILSFDDGPNAQGEVTARLLDVLHKHGVRAQFAVLGENVEAHPELLRRMDEEGHQLINHGYWDKWAVRMEEEVFRENLKKGGAAISAALGREWKPKLYRPHGGFYNARQEKICREEGYQIVPVTLRLYDAVLDGREPSKVVSRAIEKVEREGGGILLLHDGRESHVRMKKKLQEEPEGAFNRSWVLGVTEELIVELRSRGFRLNDW